MNKCTLLLAGLLASPAIALEVTILDAAYMTDLFVQQRDPLVAQALPTTSSTPISNELSLGSNPPYPLNGSLALASADTFLVSTSTAALGGRATATAATTLTFSPLADGIAPLFFDFSGSGATVFSAGYVSLFDITANQSLFYYSWTGIGQAAPSPGSTVISSSIWLSGAPWVLDLATGLFDSHDYMLKLNVGTNASSDSQGYRIAMSGFTPAVPEPETLAMMLLGLSVVGLARRFIHKAEDDDGRPVA